MRRVENMLTPGLSGMTEESDIDATDPFSKIQKDEVRQHIVESQWVHNRSAQFA